MSKEKYYVALDKCREDENSLTIARNKRAKAVKILHEAQEEIKRLDVSIYYKKEKLLKSKKAEVDAWLAMRKECQK